MVYMQRWVLPEGSSRRGNRVAPTAPPVATAPPTASTSTLLPEAIEAQSTTAPPAKKSRKGKEKATDQGVVAMDVDEVPKVTTAKRPAKRAAPTPAVTPIPKVAAPVVDLTDIKAIKGGVSKVQAKANFYLRLKALESEVQVTEDMILEDGRSPGSVSHRVSFLTKPVCLRRRTSLGQEFGLSLVPS